MPRIALLTRYDTQGASSRVRTLQYLPVLHQAGIETEHFPLFDNDYLKRMYGGQSINLQRLQLLARRILKMPSITGSGRFDLLWIEKELLPYLPFGLEKWLLDNGVPYVLDFDDAIFHNYDQSGNPLVRRLLGHKIDRLMAGARLVMCGNGYLAARARNAGAPWVEILPSTIDFEKYRILPAPQQPVISADNPLRIVWIGSPSTSKYLEIIRPVLEQLTSRYPLELRIIGAEARQWPGVQSVHIPWASDTEARELNQSHLGIMPLEDTPWEQGKCGFKLIQYMAAGLPVVDLYMENNFYDMPNEGVRLAHTTPESIAQALIEILDHKETAAEMSEAGKRYMADKDLEHGFEQFYAAVSDMAARREPAEPAVYDRSYTRPAVSADVVMDEKLAEQSYAPPVIVDNSLFGRLKRIGFIRKSKLLRKLWYKLRGL